MKPVVLVVLDGWGLSDGQDNILNTVPLPTFDLLKRYYPMAALQASGISVGLPWGEPGNSEVGHITMGVGRIIYQNLPRISLSMQDGSFIKNEALLGAVAHAKDTGGAVHIMGLVGTGAVHASREHLYATLEFLKNQGISRVFVHCFTDGRDSSPTAGPEVLREIQQYLDRIGVGKIATLIGRNWAMDRNNNWDRIQKAYAMLTEGVGEIITDPVAALEASYAKDITDEYIEPLCCSDDGTTPRATVQDGDSVIFINFREDRARELTKAFVLPGFNKFERPEKRDIYFATMVEYEKDLPVSVAFPPVDTEHSLGEMLSNHKRAQFRIAETEKYAHVTYFLNGGKEDPFPGEDRVMVPSQTVERFDEAPEMSAKPITDQLVAAINNKEKNYDFCIVNYANADMVAHTGNIEAAKEAIQIIDQELSRLIKTTLAHGGCLLITADHGNVEVMREKGSGAVDTKHNDSPIPLWYVTPKNHREKTPEVIETELHEIRGLLSDVAPTVLDILDIRKHPDMQGESLLDILG